MKVVWSLLIKILYGARKSSKKELLLSFCHALTTL